MITIQTITHIGQVPLALTTHDRGALSQKDFDLTQQIDTVGGSLMKTRRLRQLIAALTARITPDEQALLATVLRPNERRLFEQMPLFDRRHSLDVYQTLVQAGHIDQQLLKAALLHDCGKVDDDGRPIPLLYYGLFVVLKALLPGLYWLAVRDGRGWWRPFVVHAQHDQRSALLVEQAGGHPELVAILRDYGAGCTLQATHLLAWADNQN